MSVNLSPLAGAGAQFFTDSGTPLTGGLLYTYSAGTTTPRTTYTDNIGATANSNPIVLDAAGRVPYEIWLLFGLNYKFVLKTSVGVTIGTWDNISGVNGSPTATSFYADAFTATAGQVLFTLSANPGSINNLDVSLDGSTLVAGDDFSWSGISITLNTPAFVNQRLRVAYSTVDGVQAISPGSVIDNSVAVGTDLYNRIHDTVSVKDFGAVGDGVTDDTAAIQAAIAASGVGGLLIWPKGTYKVTSTLNMTYSGQHWQGAGGNGTIILFAPTANGTCVAWGTSATESVRTGISGVTFYSNDSTYTKVALNVIRCSEGIFRDISVSGSVVVSGTQMWTGATSVGIKTSGHEACRFMDLGIAADVPLQISQGASRASYANLDIDHFNFHNLYLLANANPCVLIDTGVNLTQVSFTGQQAWVLGSSGLQWVDTTSTQSSNGLSIANVRTEQGTSAAAYTFDIQHNYELQNLSLFSCLLDPTRRGIKLRKTSNVILLNASYPGTLEAFNVDGTVNRIDVRNCFWQAASTASITGQRIVSAAPLTPNTGPLSPTVLYDLATNTFRNEIHDGVISASSITVAAAGLASLGPTGVTSILMISDSIGVNAIFMLNGGNNSTYEVSDPAGQFSITAGTASSTNIYWSAGNSRYELQNNTAGTLKYVVVYLGSYSVVS